MVTVFVWPGLPHGNVGHTSMEIDCDQPTRLEYVSWWPAGAGEVSKFLAGLGVPATLYSFDDDYEAEGRANFHRIYIFGLDEPAMIRWWDAWRRDLKYRLYQRNCATTVMAGLDVGAGGSPRDGFCTPFEVYIQAVFLSKTRSGL